MEQIPSYEQFGSEGEIAPADLFPFEQPEYLEKHPIVSKETVPVKGHSIEFVNQNPNVELDKVHLEEARQVLEKISDIDPELVQSYRKVFIIEEPGVEERTKEDPDYYAPNAKNIQDAEEEKKGIAHNGIAINQIGFRADIPHRIKEVNNFQGTLAHEIFHSTSHMDKYWFKPDAENKGVLYNFRKELGYQPIFIWDKEKGLQTKAGWKEIVNDVGNRIGFANEKGDYFTKSGDVPEEPEAIPTRYARLTAEEDLCDSFVAYLYAPDKLDAKRRQFFEENFPKR